LRCVIGILVRGLWIFGFLSQLVSHSLACFISERSLTSFSVTWVRFGPKSASLGAAGQLSSGSFVAACEWHARQPFLVNRSRPVLALPSSFASSASSGCALGRSARSALALSSSFFSSAVKLP